VIDPEKESVVVALMPTESVIVLLALVTHGQDRNVAGAVDLEERNVPGASEGNYDLPQQRSVARPSFAAGERGVFKQHEGGLDGLQGSLGSRQVALDQEALQALQVLDGLEREADAVATHDFWRDRPRSSWRLSVVKAASLDT